MAQRAAASLVDPNSSSADELRITLHRIRIDMLLWNLRAFDDTEPRYRSGPYTLYTPDQIRMIKAFAQTQRQYGDGRLEAMATLLGISYGTLAVQISRVRAGRTPAYWKGIEP